MCLCIVLFQIYGISHPVRFIHQNECYCYPNNSELEINQSCSCVSEVITDY